MISIGIIGTGGMANRHAASFGKLPGVKLAACCDIAEERAKAFAEKWNIPAVYTDYNKMLDEQKLDGVSNVTPDSAHAPVSLAVIARGMAILCEKPLATTLADARKMAAAAQKRGVINMVDFSYRNCAGLQAAARLVRGGGIGRVLHVESSYLQSWLAARGWGDWRTKQSLTWRLSTRHGSAGTLGDIGCHIYDMTAMLAGEIARIDCRLATFDKGVRGNRIGPYVLDANDSFVSTVTFADGGVGTVHSSRWAIGQKNSLRARVYGQCGAVEVDLDAGANAYKICRGRKNIDAATWETVACKPTPHMWERFIKAIRTGKNDVCDFANGLKVQAYLHASMESDKQGRPVAVKA